MGATMAARGSPHFFIVGVCRSGTTLARAIVTGHPELDVPGETGFLPRLIGLQNVWWGPGGLRASIFVRLAFANGRLGRASLRPEQLRHALHAVPPTSPADAISRIYEVLCSKDPATTRVGDKTPGYVEHMELLAETFPHARFVHMVRHPLNVVASLRRQSWGPRDPVAAAYLWLRGYRAARTAPVPAERVLTVRLEDLIAAPEATVSRVADHLGVEPHPAMLQFNERAERIRRENIDPAGHTGLSRSLSTSRDWRQELSPKQAQMVWSLVGELADELGYEGPDGGIFYAPRVSERAAAYRLARFQLMRSWRRTHILLRFART
ncbi:MAG TPA: sulfotransferase [Actinopolymorphaceae bacterium]|jgi:hypothetical protein